MLRCHTHRDRFAVYMIGDEPACVDCWRESVTHGGPARAQIRFVPTSHHKRPRAQRPKPKMTDCEGGGLR